MAERRTFRASQVPQLLKCYGSEQLIKRIRENTSSAAAHLGNWCHWTAAKTLIEKQGAVGPEGGLQAPSLPPTFKPSGFGQWMADYFVQTVLNYTNVDMALCVEHEFATAFARFDLTGHMDLFAINADATEAVIGDLKAGIEVVDEAEQNGQILAYFVLAKRIYPTLRKITGFICQPQNDPDEGFERVTTATVEGIQLDGLVSYLERELNYAIDHENEINSDGWKQCRYCPVAKTGQCPAVNEELKAMKMTLTPEMIEAVKDEPSAEQLADLEVMRKKFTPIFDAAHEALKERIEKEGGRLQVAGYRFDLVEGPGRTKIVNNAKATEVLAELPDEVYHTLYEFKKEPIEKALAAQESAKTGKKVPHESSVEGKVSGKSLFREKFAGLTEQGVVKKLKMTEAA